MGLFRHKKWQERSSDRKDEDGGRGQGDARAKKKDVVGDILPPPLHLLLNAIHEMERKPPVTLLLIAIMYLVHLQATRTGHSFLLLSFALCPEQIMVYHNLSAFLLAPFIHLEDFHLYQSLASLLWKGSKLEERLGSLGFGILLVYLIVLSQALILVGAFLIPLGPFHECFTGFSSVLTAMKVILTVKSPTFTRFYNYQVPTKYGAWFELLITYIFVPKLPLLAQAAGLIAGYSYIVTPNADALVACASCNIRHFLIRIGLIKRPEQWWRVWPRFRNAVRRRISLQKT